MSSLRRMFTLIRAADGRNALFHNIGIFLCVVLRSQDIRNTFRFSTMRQVKELLTEFPVHVLICLKFLPITSYNILQGKREISTFLGYDWNFSTSDRYFYERIEIFYRDLMNSKFGDLNFYGTCNSLTRGFFENSLI